MKLIKQKKRRMRLVGSDSLNSGAINPKQPEQKKNSILLYISLAFLIVFFIPQIISILFELNSLQMQQKITQDVRQYRESPDCTIFTDEERRDECYFTHAIEAAFKTKNDSGDCSKINSQVMKEQCEKYVLKMVNSSSTRLLE